MKTLLVTLGDPGGLGPELVVRHFAKADPPADLRILLIGPEAALTHHLGRKPAFHTRIEDPAAPTGSGIYLYEPPELADPVWLMGEGTVEGGRAAGVSLSLAVNLLKSGVGHGLTTAPLNKAMLQAAGFDFPGHTEFLAERLGVGREGVCMHLGGPRLRVSLATTHPSLAEVPGLITEERILHCLRLTVEHVERLGVRGPVAVCGLNPHAGERGRIGREEIDVIEPAVRKAKDEGLDVIGPIPADTVFHFAALERYSAVLAMYHDQGLGPLKLLHFSEAVNVTLGLPYPRTSPDHGTGYDLVGTGTADLTSFVNALDLARLMMS